MGVVERKSRNKRREGRQVKVINLLRSNSDQRQSSLCNINVFSVTEVMRIKDIITLQEFCVATRKENLQCDVGN